MQEAITTARTRRPFTIIGMVLALITLGAFLFVAIRPGNGAPVSLPGGGTISIVTAKQDIPARASVTSDMLQVSKFSVNIPNSFTSVADVASAKTQHFALVDIKAGQPVLANELVSSSTGISVAAGFLDIPQGFVAITIPTSEEAGVAGYIQPGDYIGIIATVDKADVTTTRTIFNNVHVIKVGTATSSIVPGRNGPQASIAQSASGSSLTVVMNECDAEYLTWFLDRATLRYTLENYSDYDKGVANNPQHSPACPIDAAVGVTNANIASRFGAGLVP